MIFAELEKVRKRGEAFIEGFEPTESDIEMVKAMKEI